MRFLSGIRVLFIPIAIAGFAVSSVSFADDTTPPAQAVAPSSAKTAAAIPCIYGLVSKGCDTLFAARASRFGTLRVLNPYFVSATYTGTNTSGDDVWDVKFTHNEATVVIAPPDPDGKIRYVWNFEGAPNSRCFNSVGEQVPPRMDQMCK
jgi:hypothetical protein